MSYLVATIIIAISAVIETSLLPHFRLFGLVPFVTLAMIVALSVRFRGLFHFFVALAVGMYFDFLSGGVPGVFTGTFVTVALLGRVIFFRDTGYDSTQSFLWLLASSALFIYLVNGYFLFSTNFVGWQGFLLKSTVGVVLTVTIGLLILRFSSPITDWLNKENEERFR